MLAAVVAVGATPAIPLPDAATPIASVQAGGVQIYRCAAAVAGTPLWTLDHPVATLYRDDGSVFGSHGAGPMWKAADGSTIVADGNVPITRIVQTGAVPWLALRVTAHTGPGVLADARYVERFDTRGGVAPDASDCTTSTIGAVRAVHYSAVYEFFR